MDRISKVVTSRLRVPAAGPHPDTEMLSAFVEKALADAERTKVLAHLAECSHCRQVVFLALPDSLEAPQVSFKRRTWSGFLPRFAVPWGTLAAALAIAGVLFVGTRHRSPGPVSLYKQATPAKAPSQVSAELKTPSEVAEMHALRDDRASTRTSPVRDGEADKVIPTPKHMTAKPAAKFDFDESGQVRMTAGSETRQTDKFEAQNTRAPGKLAVAPAAPVPAQAIGGLIENQNGFDNYSGQGSGATTQSANARGNLSGAVFDPSGAVIHNATVTMNGPIGSQTALSDATGQFSFQQVASGSYAIKAQAPGFKTIEVQRVAVLDNKESNLRVTLQPGNANEAVEVSANELANAQLEVRPAPAFESTNGKVAQNSRQEDQLARKKALPDSVTLLAATGLNSTPQWTLSAHGAVERSIDSGHTWQAVPLGSGGFRSLCALGSHVWVGGKAGVLYHSADSGQTWTQVIPLLAGRKLESDITQVNFSDAVNGEIDTNNSESWITSDGGRTWRLK
jgi:Carboxypeptidase regulatory-like domain/Photosynthesis system II assembly factor YCF48/Putative zinc-finger